jgi:hypothetical protein
MATVNKDFKVKNGLIVEGTTATVNNFDVLTKKTDDQNYIIGLIGGSSDSANTPNTVVKRDGSGDFAAGTITADLIGDVTGTVSSLSNHNTDDLSEGTSNKYFTNQRAVDANTGLWDTIGAATDAYNDAVLAAQQYTDGEIADEVTARNNAVQGAYNDAVADAATDATTKANAAEAAANLYTDNAITSEVTRSNNYADGAATNALNDANDYTDARETAITTAYQSYADTAATTAENNAKAYADGLSSGLNWKQAVHLLYDDAIPTMSGSGATQLIIDGHDVLGDADSGYRILITNAGATSGIYVYNSTGGSWTLTRAVDADAYSELVGAAVFVMEGTNYGSTAWVQAEHYLSSFTGQSWTQFSGQGTYLAGNGLTLDGTTFEIDTTITATKLYADGVATDAENAAKSYTDNRETAITTAYQNYANTAASNALDDANAYTDTRETAITNAYETYADGVALTAKNDAKAYADGLVSDEVTDRNNAINNAINALTTSDIEEGTNLYYTAARAKAEAATLLANATKTNIVITKDGSNNLTITAENGVADSTTDDLAEGTSHLYFTNARAVSALEAVTPDFPSVEIASVAKQVAASHNVPTASTHTAYAWLHASYRSAEFLVKIASGSHTDVSKVILTLDTSNNIAITEYAMVGTNGSLGSVSADIDSGTGSVRLRVTTLNNNSDVLVVGTLLV